MSTCQPVNLYTPAWLFWQGKLLPNITKRAAAMSDHRSGEGMRLRETDTQPGALARDTVAAVKITREIPLWGILSVVGVLGGQAVSTYYGQQQLTEKVAVLTTEVRTLSIELNRASHAQTAFEYKVEDLRRRIDALEEANRSRKP